MGRKTVDGGFEPGMDAELAILAAIESRYNEELAKLERSPKPPDDKERLRQQLVEALSAIATCFRQEALAWVPMSAPPSRQAGYQASFASA